MRILYFDTETTGLNPRENEIIQLAAVMELDGKIIDEINLHMQPTNWDGINLEALAVNKMTIEQLKSFPTPKEAYIEFKAFLDRNIDKFSYSGKPFPAGHNVFFDLEFVHAFFKKYGDSFGFGSYQNWRKIDTQVLANIMVCEGIINIPNIKLSTLCEYYHIPLEAHDALNDIKATRLVYKALINDFKLQRVLETKI